MNQLTDTHRLNVVLARRLHRILGQRFKTSKTELTEEVYIYDATIHGSGLHTHENTLTVNTLSVIATKLSLNQ